MEPNKVNWTKSSLKKKFDDLGYNMLDTGMAAETALENPAKTYKDLKVLAHKALATGRDNVEKDQYDKANSNFAFAYQMRCVCDWIWTNLLGKEGNKKHAAYLQLSRDFGKLCSNNKTLSESQKAVIIKQIAAIKD